MGVVEHGVGCADASLERKIPHLGAHDLDPQLLCPLVDERLHDLRGLQEGTTGGYQLA